MQDETQTMQEQLLIVEDFMLMLLDDDSGAIAGAGTLHYSLGGAVLVELALIGRIEIDEEETGLRVGLNGPVVRTVGEGPLPDSLLQSAWDTVSSKPQRVQPAILAIGAGLWEPVIERLVERGVIRREKKRVLGIFSSTRLPVDDSRHEDELRGRIVAVLEDGATPDPHTAAVIAMLSSSGVLPTLHPAPKWSTQTYERAKELEKGSWGAEAVNTAVVRTAAAIAASSAAVAITVAKP